MAKKLSTAKTVALLKKADRVRRFGEVFTPLALVEEMLDRLPRDIWSDPLKTVIDPSCGEGAFITEALRRKLVAGCEPLIAVATVFGVELQADNAIECRRQLVEIACDAEPEARLHPVIVLIVEANIAIADALRYDYRFLPVDGDTEQHREAVSFMSTVRSMTQKVV